MDEHPGRSRLRRPLLALGYACLTALVGVREAAAEVNDVVDTALEARCSLSGWDPCLRPRRRRQTPPGRPRTTSQTGGPSRPDPRRRGPAIGGTGPPRWVRARPQQLSRHQLGPAGAGERAHRGPARHAPGGRVVGFCTQCEPRTLCGRACTSSENDP